MWRQTAAGVATPGASSQPGRLVLPAPKTDGTLSVEAALQQRRSRREYAPRALTLSEVGQVLWAAQGVTSASGQRTAPSAGALYPLEVYAVLGDVEGVASGLYKYQPAGHELELVQDGDHRAALSRVALGQAWVQVAPVSLVICAVHERTAARYGQRSVRYVDMEVGHAAQNVYLQAEALGLGAVAVGAFHDEQVRQVLALPPGEAPLLILPLGAVNSS